MNITLGRINGEVTLAFVPETHEELRILLAEHEHEAICPDCEQTLQDIEAELCPHCREGIGCEPEFVAIRPIKTVDDCPDFDLDELE